MVNITNTLYLSNVINQSVIDSCIHDYDSRDQYDTDTMNKAAIGQSLKMLVDLVKSAIGNNIEYRSGNFYQHILPYLPHTDYRVAQDNTINVVVPLRHRELDASLVIFDQMYFEDSVTWCMHYPLLDFKVNTGIKGHPKQYQNVTGLTDNEIDEDLYNKYLSRYPKNTLDGLTGQAYAWLPGNMLIFDNRRIHCTSTYTGVKLGVSLRFAIT